MNRGAPKAKGQKVYGGLGMFIANLHRAIKGIIGNPKNLSTLAPRKRQHLRLELESLANFCQATARELE